MKRSDLFMSAVYSAVADEEIPMIWGFGNGAERGGNAFIDSVLLEYPVLDEYMNGTRSIEDAFNRYTCYKNGWNYEDYKDGKPVGSAV
jgi:hypothetical protein